MDSDSIRDLNFQTAHLRGMQRRERLLAEAEAAGDGATVTALALEDCVAKRYITDAASLENPDEISGETALITQSFLGEVAVATRLLQAGANSNALILEGKVCRVSPMNDDCIEAIF